MRTNKTKEEFINDILVRIETRKEVLNIYEKLLLPLLKRLDGEASIKKFNIQFDKLLKANNIKNVSLKNCLRDRLHFTNYCYILDKQNYEVNYSDVESLRFQIVLNGGRIDFKDTISNEDNIFDLNKFKDGITSYERCINNYNEYMKIAKETEEKIKEFNDMHHLFRQSIKIEILLN